MANIEYQKKIANNQYRAMKEAVTVCLKHQPQGILAHLTELSILVDSLQPYVGQEFGLDENDVEQVRKANEGNIYGKKILQLKAKGLFVQSLAKIFNVARGMINEIPEAGDVIALDICAKIDAICDILGYKSMAEILGE